MSVVIGWLLEVLQSNNMKLSRCKETVHYEELFYGLFTDDWSCWIQWQRGVLFQQLYCV